MIVLPARTPQHAIMCVYVKHPIYRYLFYGEGDSDDVTTVPVVRVPGGGQADVEAVKVILNGKEQRGLKACKAWAKDERISGLAFTGEYHVESDVIAKFGGATKLPAYPGARLSWQSLT